MKSEIKVVDLARVKVAQGEALVIHIPEETSMEEAYRLRDTLAAWKKESGLTCSVLVLRKGTRIEVVKDESVASMERK